MKLTILAALLLTGCATVPEPSLLANCAAYDLQLHAAEKAVKEGKLSGDAAAAEKARLLASAERAACLGRIY